MPKNMSFMLTVDQFRNQTKDVTRRRGWGNLKPGDVLMGCEKCMGLKRGEKIKRLGLIRIISTRPEQLDSITQEEVIREGFPNKIPSDFVVMFVLSHKGTSPSSTVNRIEYEYL
jgi:hypothetical protein